MTAQFTLDAPFAPAFALGRLGEPQASRAASATNPALFLHTGWRSAGTWIWSCLREDPGVMAFYEPLNEQLGTLNAARIARLRPGHWKSGHGGAAPYYSEFRDLVHRGRGVQGYQERFAADRFFLDENQADPALEAYIALLLHRAHVAGRVPVLKFCRSLGRVSWMQRHFPEALHAVVLRDPQAQWRSARMQAEQCGNPYFLTGPLLILARNASHKLAAEALERLGVALPALSPNGSLALDQEICWRHLERLPWSARYRAFLACWTASAIAAFAGCTGQPDPMVIDSDELLTSRPHRESVETAILAELGIPLSLATQDVRGRDAAPCAHEPADQDAMARAHEDAVGLLQSCGSHLPESSFLRIACKLMPAREVAKPSRSASIHLALRPSSQSSASWRQSLYCTRIRLSMAWRRVIRRTRRMLLA